jgi:hypothetical protein
MTPEIPQGLVNRLVQIGREERFAELETIETDFPSAKCGDLMRLRPEAWARVVMSLTDAEVVFLIKALTKLELHPSFRAGSVSPVIFLFRALPEALKRVDLINWILANTENSYLPFGSSNHGAKSIDEYYRLAEYLGARIAARHKAEQDRQSAAESKRVAVASQRLFGAIRRKDEKAIKALLAQGADPGVRDASGQTALQAAMDAGLGHLFNVD